LFDLHDKILSAYLKTFHQNVLAKLLERVNSSNKGHN
jgi:hypothetical protein